MKRICSILLIMVLMITTIPCSGISAHATTGEFAGGSGTESDPYLISTKYHLDNVRNYLDAHFKMIADIEFTDADFAESGEFYNNGQGWKPISSFEGGFDGNGCTISGIKISFSTNANFASYTKLYVGLFGYSTGTIKNVSLTSINYSVYDHSHEVHVGGLVGYSTSAIEDVSISGKINASSASKDINVGGVVGNSNSNLINTQFSGEINGTITMTSSATVSAGGIAGHAVSITNSNNAGAVTSTGGSHSYAGGIVGYNGNVTECYNIGFVSASEYAGGISGYSLSSIIENCYNIGTVTSSNYAGGIIGQLYDGEINNCYNLRNVTASNHAGSIAGGSHGTISNCYCPDSHDYAIGGGSGSVTKKNLDDLKKQSTFVGFDFSQVWTMSGNPNFMFPEIKNNEINLSPISFDIVKLPNKTQYLEGKDSLNMSGAKGKIIFSNGFEDEITLTSNMVEGFDNTIPGTQLLTVTHAGLTDTFIVTITKKSLSSIEVTKAPTKTTYLEFYDLLDISGGQITLYYNNGTTEKIDLTNEMVSGFDNSIVGKQQLEVSYLGKTTSFDVEIVPKNIDHIALEVAPTKLTYIGFAEKLDTAGGRIRVYYDNETSELVDVSEIMVTGFDNRILGKQTLTITYEELTLTYNIEILENTLEFSGGIGTVEKPFIIKTITHLGNIKKYPTAHYVIENDLTFDPEGQDYPNGWKPFYFSGTLDGKGFSIKDLRMIIGVNTGYYGGLFSSNNGIIQNLTIDNAKIIVEHGSADAGFLATYNYGTIVNCHTKGCNVSQGKQGTITFGGVVAFNNGDILNSTSENTIAWKTVASGIIGGITGENNGIIDSCTNKTTITVVENEFYASPIAGGIAGTNGGEIVNSRNLVTIDAETTVESTTAYAGGIVGTQTGGKIHKCYNAGSISAKATEHRAHSYTAGIVANITGGKIIDCYNTADVYGESHSSYANSYIGGVIGYNNTIGTIKNCYSIGNNSGRASSKNLYVGYICGYNASDTIENCYYLGVTDNGTGFGDSSGMYGNTIPELKSQDTYVGFDFENVWIMAGNADYPFPELKSTGMEYTPKITSISLNTLPNKTEYFVGCESLDLAGGTIKVTYKYDIHKIIELADAQITGFDQNRIGNQTISVMYAGFLTNYNVKVNDIVLKKIEMSVLPFKTVYHRDRDSFDPLGGKVKLFYNNNTQETIDLTESMISNFSNKKVGTKTVRVMIDGIYTHFDVRIEDHLYDNICDKDCNICGDSRTVGSHQYTNACDTICNVCQAPRTTSHTYTNVCDNACNICGDTREIEHKYDDTCDTNCNACGMLRTITHKFGNYVYNNDATASKDGTKSRTCSVCKKTETVTVAGTRLKNPFKDVKAGQYYTDPVLWAVSKHITNGTSATTFAPSAECTRGQIVTFLWRAAGSPEPTSTRNPFKDVKSNQYYYKAVLWAVEKGITTGTSANTFSPDAACTRGQVVTFLWRAKAKPAASGSNAFKDVKSGAYYYDAVRWAVKNNITNGMSATSFAPDATCTRGQIVTFLYRAYK